MMNSIGLALFLLVAVAIVARLIKIYFERTEARRGRKRLLGSWRSGIDPVDAWTATHTHHRHDTGHHGDTSDHGGSDAGGTD